MTFKCLSVIPANPGFIPPADRRDTALGAFREMLPAADSVDCVVHKEVSFIDSGVRFETVSCPFCGAELDPIWWGDAMNAAGGRGFNDLSVQLPCCDAMGTLNDLNYRMPSGFARFLLKAREPKTGELFPADQMHTLENILDTPLKQIWADYKEFDQGQVRVYSRMGAVRR